MPGRIEVAWGGEWRPATVCDYYQAEVVLRSGEVRRVLLASNPQPGHDVPPDGVWRVAL